MLIWLLVGLAAAIALAYRQAAATLWLGAGLVWLVVGYLFNAVAVPGIAVAAVLVVLPALVLAIKPLRRKLLTTKALGLFRTIMPAMSDTERAAIESGPVGGDAELV
ncbi:acyl-CoA dehydrogenase, partial [Pseudomonas carnis]|nr:acyl-CoA dehydrogenase [Pseudomonas carnis]